MSQPAQPCQDCRRADYRDGEERKTLQVCLSFQFGLWLCMRCFLRRQESQLKGAQRE